MGKGERKTEETDRKIESMGKKREKERKRARAYVVPYASLRGMVMCQAVTNITPQALQPCR